LSCGHGVLVVEDDDDLRESLSILLARRGFPVTTAANGKEALDLIDPAAPPCMIILDLMMPEMDGWELRSWLLADPNLRKVPVVVVSGVADLRRVDLHAAEYLKKPVDLDRLYGLVRALC